MGSLPDIIGGEEPPLYLYQRIAMGVLDIIDTNTVELSKPGVRLAMKEVRYHALSLSLSLCCVFILIYPLMSSGRSHITRYQEGSAANKKTVPQGTRENY